MDADSRLLDVRAVLTRADHQTHRAFAFDVPEGTSRLDMRVRYAPKFVSNEQSDALVRQAVATQHAALTERVGAALAESWAANFAGAQLRVPNLLTVSLDDARGAYRGAAHRHAPEQRLWLAVNDASPGLMRGPLPPGRWSLRLTAHTIVSDQCEVEIQIGALTASRRP